MIKSMFKRFLPLIILGMGLLASSVVFVQAQRVAGVAQGPSDQNISAAGIMFPVPELGNCKDKDDCKNYCSRPANMQTCIAFAQSRGLMNREESEQAKKFVNQLQAGGGPGGCKTPQECETFCSDIKNIESCIKFAERNGIKDKDTEEGEKILKYLQAGGRLPGGCTSKESCENYCGDFNHAGECLAFAEKAGVGPASPPAGRMREGNEASLAQMKKIMELTRKGESPGGCKSKNQCESYCKDQSHFGECVVFAEKAGFITKDQAEMARKTGGKGPGGCDSEDSCKSYCNDPAHRDECFKFAKDHGLIPPEHLQEMQQGMVRLRQGLEQAPPEVASCLKSTLGPSVIEDIQSGKLTPGPDIGERMKNCFEKFGKRGDPKEAFEHAPPQVLGCLKEKLGANFGKMESGEMMPTPEMGDAMRICFQQFQMQSDRGVAPGGRPDFSEFLRGAPPEMTSCLQKKFGSDFAKLQSGQLQMQADLKDKIESCFKDFRPREQEDSSGERWEKTVPQLVPPSPPQNLPMMPIKPKEWGQPPSEQRVTMPGFPPEVLACLKSSVPGDALEKFIGGGAPPSGDIIAAMKNCMLKTVPQPSLPASVPVQPRVDKPSGTQLFTPPQMPPQRSLQSPYSPAPSGPPTTTPPHSFEWQPSSLANLLQTFAPLLGL